MLQILLLTVSCDFAIVLCLSVCSWRFLEVVYVSLIRGTQAADRVFTGTILSVLCRPLLFAFGFCLYLKEGGLLSLIYTKIWMKICAIQHSRSAVSFSCCLRTPTKSVQFIIISKKRRCVMNPVTVHLCYIASATGYTCSFLITALSSCAFLCGLTRVKKKKKKKPISV